MLEKLMSQLEQDLAMDNLTPSEEGRTHLSFDNQINVEAIELEKKIILKGLIGEPPQQNQNAFLLKVMEANLFGIGTRSTVIGLNDEGKLLTLSMELDYNSSFKDFKEKLEDFISVIEFWRIEAQKHQ
jgi:hypothetical protein